MAPTIEFDPVADTWLFAGERRLYDGAYSLVLKRQDLSRATATDLARALRTARRHELEPESVLIDLAPDDEYSPKESVVDSISFHLGQDTTLLVKVGFTNDRYAEDDQQLNETVGPTLEPYLRRHNSRLIVLRADAHRSSAPYFHEAEIAVPTRSKSLLDLYTIADDLLKLIDAADSGQLTLQTTLHLLRGGRADLLIGLPENSWLDVKSQHYDLNSPRGPISVAEAVACFCNAEDGGIVVVGMEGKKRPDGEIVKSISPVPIGGPVIRRYRQAIENKLFPFPTGLTVEAVETGAGQGLVLISVPPQPEELKPFLVHGAIADGKVQGAYISILRRSGQDSIPITAEQIHSTLAAGRALLRRGQLPEDLE